MASSKERELREAVRKGQQDQVARQALAGMVFFVGVVVAVGMLVLGFGWWSAVPFIGAVLLNKRIL